MFVNLRAAKMPFGKFRGYTLKEVPSYYLSWLATKSSNKSIALEAQLELQHRIMSGKD